MSRALRAAAKSKLVVVLDGLHLEPEEVVNVALVMAVRHGRKLNLDGKGLHDRLDQAITEDAEASP